MFVLVKTVNFRYIFLTNRKDFFFTNYCLKTKRLFLKSQFDGEKIPSYNKKDLLSAVAELAEELEHK